MTPAGRVLAGRYELVAPIGEGGNGVVWRALPLAGGPPVAVKLLSADLATDPAWVRRFRVEAAALARLVHPNTVRVLDSGIFDGIPFLILELLEGETARATLAREGRLAPRRVLEVVAQAAEALAEAHAVGIVHRDLKPDNLFLTRDPSGIERVKVLDFSVAKLLAPEENGLKTAQGVVFGTPEYMSPEQARGLPLDGRSDLYALGVVAFELMTGRVPFAGGSADEIFAGHVFTPPPPLEGIPSETAGIVLTCLEKDPARRFSDAAALAAACRRVLRAGAGGRPQRDPSSSRPSPSDDRRPQRDPSGSRPSPSDDRRPQRDRTRTSASPDNTSPRAVALVWFAAILGGIAVGVAAYLITTRIWP